MRKFFPIYSLFNLIVAGLLDFLGILVVTKIIYIDSTSPALRTGLVEKVFSGAVPEMLSNNIQYTNPSKP